MSTIMISHPGRRGRQDDNNNKWMDTVNDESIDEGTIGEQIRIREHWEGRISLEDQSNLYPRPPPISPPLTTTGPHGVYCSENIDRDSIANLGSTKQHWESKVIESSDEASQQQQQRVVTMQRTSKSRLAPLKGGSTTSSATESAIDREIRLAREREEALKREHGSMPSEIMTKTSPPLLTSSKGHKMSPLTSATSYHEMTEADRGCESIIEREIREQQEREIRLLAEHHKAPVVASETKTEKSPPIVHSEKRVLSQQHSNNGGETPTRATWQQVSEPLQPSEIRTPEPSAGRRQVPAHESMIARELREQSEREAELRAHWHSMGLQIAEPSLADTPFDPEQLQMRPHPRGGGRDAGSCVRYGGGGNTGNGVISGTHTAAVVTGNVVQNGDDSGGVMAVQHTYEDDVDGDVRTYTPQSETAIEREIRLTQAREHELRSVRGLPPLSPTHPEPPPSPDLVAKARHVKANAMKRLASGRLQAEIRQDQEKELVLRNEGKIKTTSDELTGLPPTISAPPPPTAVTPAPVVMRKAASRGRTESKIEEELREMQQREDELRQQRDLLQTLTLDHPPASSEGCGGPPQQHSPSTQLSQRGSGGPHSPRVVPLDQVELLHRHDKAAGKAGRRRSGLAAQWERTCAENQ